MIGAVIGAGLASAPDSQPDVDRRRLVGGAIGWLIGAWGGAELGTAALVRRCSPPSSRWRRSGLDWECHRCRRRQPGEIEERSRAWIFVTPALFLVTAGLVVPLVRTIILSFKDRNSEESVGWTNYGDVIFSRRPAVTEEFVDATDWFDWLIGSRLCGSASPSWVLRS